MLFILMIFKDFLTQTTSHRLGNVRHGMDKYVLGMILSMLVEERVAVAQTRVALAVHLFAPRQDIVKKDNGTESCAGI